MNTQTAPLPPEPADEGDAALAIAAGNGSRDAFRRLYERHAAGLMASLWRLCGGDRALAEDVLQDAFVQAWRKLDQLRDPGAFGAWLKRMAVNLALQHKRGVKLVDVTQVPEQAAPQPPWPGADRDLELAILRLPARARQVLVLFHLEGWRHEEIALLMKIEVGTSKAQLHRARALLKEWLST